MGHRVPEDLELLLANSENVQKLTGIEFSDKTDWVPWLDVSYLSEKQLNDPDIAANIKAIAAVSQYISFVAATEDSEYIGYWRGPQTGGLLQAPIVCLDNEGQFNAIAGRNIAEALLGLLYNANTFTNFKQLIEDAGMSIPYSSYREIPFLEDSKDAAYVSPSDLHKKLYYEFRTNLVAKLD